MGDLRMTKKVFEELPDKDEVTWYAMLSSYINKFNDMEKARDLFEKIPCKDLVIWNTIILGYVKAGGLGARKRFGILNTIIEGLVRDRGLMKRMGDSSYEMQRVNLLPDDEVFLKLNAVIGTALWICIASVVIWRVPRCLHKMSERDVVAWSAMIMGSLMNGQSRTALNFFYRMKDESERPNDATIFLGVLVLVCMEDWLMREGVLLWHV
ncbi:hypothetical protein HAX54_051956 [Datura stramonium]|uniref:Pentatricopeptide repeat-containing protein n=1 Tax=Datura stramonium TaxID=4076 RepID=A0ABS8SYB6_DATST|nr:hypothetical protein [Datura stramonium]